MAHKFSVASSERFFGTYLILVLSVLLFLALHVLGVRHPWLSGAYSLLALPANAFLEVFSSAGTVAGLMGDALLLVQLLVIVGISLAYFYLISSVLVALKDEFMASQKHLF